MKISRNLIFILFAVLAFQAYPQEVERYELDNGLTVYLNENHNSPEVFGMMVVRVGSKNDPADATGLAHYQEHMLFKGTTQLSTTNWEEEKVHIDRIFELYDELGNTTDEEERSELQKQINEESVKANEYAIPNEFSNVLKSIGSKNLNAGTGPDETVYYNSFPPNQIEKWLELYAHRLKEPVFRGFQSELEVVYEEKNMYSDEFISNLFEEFLRQFYKNHPYGQQTALGSIEHLKNPSLNKMYNFFKTYYVSNNMALILSGNFDAGQVKPLIEKSFGDLEKGSLPEEKVWDEEPFRGREFAEGNLSPVRIGLLGFRTAPEGHPDRIALDVAQNILSNYNQSGLMDELAIDNKLMAAEVMAVPYNDHGLTMMIFVPKIVGQKLDAAEELVLGKLQELKDGNFEEWKVDAAKKDLYVEFQGSIEDPEGMAEMISEAFILDKSIEDVLSYPEKVKSVSKQDVVNIANKYFGENYLAFYSKMGFKKPEKLDKPGFEPVIPDGNAKSEYARYLETIPSTKVIPDYVDFEKDMYRETLRKNLHFYHIKNPVNDIFSMEIKFGVGKIELPMLQYSGDIMNYSGTSRLTVNELKQEFSKLGCSYYVYSDNNYVTISIEGMEEHLSEAIILVNELLNSPALEESKLDVILEEAKAEREFEKADAESVAYALYQYIKFGEKSEFLDRLSQKEIKGLEISDLMEVFKKAIQYEVQIHYVGEKDSEEVEAIIKDKLVLSENLIDSKSPQEHAINKYPENIVYLVNKKKAVQSKVYFFANQDYYGPEKQAYVDAFNMYFGGDFSGLVLQEIREYRSLAYSAGARVTSPLKINGNTYFAGYVGTQSDKTLEALETFNKLVREMPEKPERMPMIKDYLSQSSIINKPTFRYLSEAILSWERKGYTEDPAKFKANAYENLQFEDIVELNDSRLKNSPMVIAIVGDKSRIDMDELKKYGKIIEVKEKKLFKN